MKHSEEISAIIVSKMCVVTIPAYFSDTVAVAGPNKLNSKEEAQKRIDAQISIEEKKILADFLINNSFDMKFLESEIEKFIKFVRGKYANCKI